MSNLHEEEKGITEFEGKSLVSRTDQYVVAGVGACFISWVSGTLTNKLLNEIWLLISFLVTRKILKSR